MHIVVTRPVEDAKQLAEKLVAGGYSVTLEPMMEIRMRDDLSVDLDGVQALLFTSANGVRAFVRASDERDLPTFTVGPASAKAAEAEGFTNVSVGSGDVTGLADLVSETLRPADGALLHVAGSDVAGDLAGTLEGYGFEIRREVAYQATPRDSLSRSFIQDMMDAGVAGILFYSPRTVRIFKALADQATLAFACNDVDAYCLSDAVAVAAGELPFMKIFVAKTADEEGMLGLLGIGN